LMLSDARMASLSARVGSSLEGTLAERMTHISHRFTFTARRSARLRGEPSSKRREKKEKKDKKIKSPGFWVSNKTLSSWPWKFVL
jgi:hypothetical protein